MNTILGKDKNQLLLFLYQGRTINRQAFDQYFFPNGTSQTEFIHEIVGPYDIVEYELFAFIADGRVDHVDARKIQDVPVGHGRPRSIEKTCQLQNGNMHLGFLMNASRTSPGMKYSV